MSKRPEPRPPLGCTPLEIDLRHEADVPIVVLRGSCTMEFAPELTQQLMSVAAEPHPVLVLDLSGLDFVESSGLGAIIAGYLRCRKRNGEFRIAGTRPPIRRLFEITRLDQLFKLYDSVELALQPALPV